MEGDIDYPEFFFGVDSKEGVRLAQLEERVEMLENDGRVFEVISMVQAAILIILFLLH